MLKLQVQVLHFCKSVTISSVIITAIEDSEAPN
jgi:hypothetical protein